MLTNQGLPGLTNVPCLVFVGCLLLVHQQLSLDYLPPHHCLEERQNPHLVTAYQVGSYSSQSAGYTHMEYFIISSRQGVIGYIIIFVEQ